MVFSNFRREKTPKGWPPFENPLKYRFAPMLRRLTAESTALHFVVALE